MGKGICERRRRKQFIKAHEGNLHKALIGKATLSAFQPLPDAPKSNELVDRVPRSLKKLLELKAAAEAPKRSANKKNKSGANGQGATGTSISQDDQPVSSDAESASKKEEQVKARPSGLDASGLDRGLVEQAGVQKKLKQSKKDYLNRKKLKKKGKLSKDEPTALEKDLQERNKVNFGERSDAPLEVNLKRKHWHKEKTASERCKEVFLKQINEAQKRDAARRHGVPELGQSAAKRARIMDDSPAAQEKLRQEAIEAYRAKKRGNTNGATMTSLAKLVKAGHAALAQ